MQMDEGDYQNFIRAGCVDEESYLQEFMTIAADDNAAFLPYDLIAGAEYPQGRSGRLTYSIVRILCSLESISAGLRT